MADVNEPVITREIPVPPRRSEDAHKGEMGRVAVVGGCSAETTMIGAPALVANTAYRGGAGLVRIVVPEPIVNPVGVLSPCATLSRLHADPGEALEGLKAFRADVLAIGPGLGRSLEPGALVEIVNECGTPVVIDADGLNLLANAGDIRLRAPERIVLTPHAGELQRLLAARGVDRGLDRSFNKRRDALMALFDCYGCVATLKGSNTLVTNGKRVYINETGNDGMATGGTGDVLTGLLAALLGQGFDPFEATVLAVYLHGLAGDFAAEELGRASMTAFDLIEYIPEAYREYETSALDLP